MLWLRVCAMADGLENGVYCSNPEVLSGLPALGTLRSLPSEGVCRVPTSSISQVHSPPIPAVPLLGRIAQLVVPRTFR